MPGSKSGGIKARDTNYAKQGRDFYKRIGAVGGRKGRTGGFYYMKTHGMTARISELGRIGGHTSRRGKRKVSDV